MTHSNHRGSRWLSMKTNTDTNRKGKLTPLMQQYWDVKSAHEDKVLLFRMGDFFEMFHRDAEIAAPVLGIALTSRNKKAEDETPMCGVPHHSIANSINKLLQNGFKVAICDQIEDPKFAKGLVKRAVTRILSPGMVYDPDTLDGQISNYLASFDHESVSFVDTTTGEAFYFKVRSLPRKLALLAGLQPVELVLSQKEISGFSAGPSFDPLITVHDGLLSVDRELPKSASRLLAYAVHMQGEGVLETLSPFEERDLLDRMELPATVLRHLEIFETYKGETRGSLFDAINRCKTSAGARLLRQWLQFPLCQFESIDKRLDQIDFWVRNTTALKEIRKSLAKLGDIQRRIGKLGHPNCHPRDLLSLAESLAAGLDVVSLTPNLQWDERSKQDAKMICDEITRTLVDEPPLQMKSGGFLRKGMNVALDELIDLATNSNHKILQLEQKERELTGISSLKIRFNQVFGYYIEITNTHKDKVPKDRYDRKQTLANAERYLTQELAELESKVLSAQTKKVELELEILAKLVAQTLEKSQSLLLLARQWAELDVLTSNAWLALEQRYVRPRFVDNGCIQVIGSRHPVIEQVLDLPFVANDIELPKGGCLLLTGPNMAGKSTLMRQVALTCIMGQSGLFVPAAEANLPVLDRIFTRIGASDFLSEGLSTFMVEMKETAEMLESATANSLVVLDEIGRGTSTYDGMSLAQAILEFLLVNKRPLTLFATHYHELTRLASEEHQGGSEKRYPQLLNAHMSIHEKDGEITFLHQLVGGPANKSYGIQVGKLAGLPSWVTQRASHLLKNMESHQSSPASPQLSLLDFVRETEGVQNAELTIERVTDQERDESSLNKMDLQVLEDIKGLEVDHLTPMEAFRRVVDWKESLN